ncbi:MAG: hypothetical protein DSY31_00915 [Alphaproteobacteria bacterium]|nr:MAG: hypothetical protein DSY31_00915 [Alphaproteobacteria bacterium]
MKIKLSELKKIIQELEDDLAEHTEKHGPYASAKLSSTTRDFLRGIRREKKELEKWEIDALAHRRITIGNIKKAQAFIYSRQNGLQGILNYNVELTAK